AGGRAHHALRVGGVGGSQVQVNAQDVDTVGPPNRRRQRDESSKSRPGERRGGVARAGEVVGEDRQSKRQRKRPAASKPIGRGSPVTSTLAEAASGSRLALNSTYDASSVFLIRARRTIFGSGLPHMRIAVATAARSVGKILGSRLRSRPPVPPV